MTEKTLKELTQRGHKIGTQNSMTIDGKNVISIDGRMLTFAEVDELAQRQRGNDPDPQ